MCFLKKIIFRFPFRKNIIFPRKKNVVFPDNTRKIILRRGVFGRATFRKVWRGIIFPSIFYQKDHLWFSIQGTRSYFRGKEISSFLMIQEISYSSVILLERPSFQKIWKKKIWFFVQRQAWPKNQNSPFKLKFGTMTNSNQQNSMVVFAFSVLDWKHRFWAKFGPKNQNCQFKLKFGSYNQFHNILRFFNVLSNFPFTTSETMGNYYL